MFAIVHHWDTDGICSAALIANMLESNGMDWKNYTPPIGKFELDNRIRKSINDFEKVFFLDLNISLEDIKKQVIFIDHHIQAKISKENVQYINPIIEGGRSSEDFPSATWIISTYFSLWNHLSALGVIGDKGEKIFNEKIGQKVKELLKTAGLSLDDSLKLVSLIDSNYIVMDREGVENAVKEVMNNPKHLLNHDKWLENLEKIRFEVDKARSNLEFSGNFAEIDFESGYNIISKVARLAVWKQGYSAVLAINRDFNGSAQIYFRINPSLTLRINMQNIINKLKDASFNVGGKKEVLGVICPKSRLEEVVSFIKSEAGFE